MPERDGDIIDGRFAILGRLGSGGMSDVFKAKDRVTGDVVALKTLSKDFLAQHPHETEHCRLRFAREARILEALRGIKQVVSFVSSNLDGAMPWIAMEFVEGQTLRQAMDAAAAGLEPRTIVAVARDIVAGLRAIHARRVLHRDLAPGNIIVRRSRGGEPSIRFLDFGIGKSLDGNWAPVTQQPTLMGRPQYLAPEQTRGGELTAGADVYAAGVILYEMITGHLPIKLTSFAEVARVRREPPRPMANWKRSARVPEELRALVMSALEKRPDDRPTTDEMLECLDEIRRRLGLGYDISAAFSDVEIAALVDDREEAGLLRPGQRVGDFELQWVFGRGPRSEVWSAVHVETRREAALRILSGPRGEREAAIDRAQAQIGLEHENFARVIATLTLDDLACIARAPERSGTLRRALDQDGALTPARFLHVACGIVEGLAFAHSQSPPVVHGALSPARILLDEFDGARVADFGIGGDPRSVDLHAAPGQELLYSAPEVVLGEPPDRGSDIYSLGAIFYVMATNAPPHEGNEAALAFKHVNVDANGSPLEPIDSAAPGMRRLILDCLSRRPDDRPIDIEAVRTRLNAAFAKSHADQPLSDRPRRGLFDWLRAARRRP